MDGGAGARLWRAVASRYPSYDLVLPGENSFICRAATCNAWCCRALNVPLGDGDVARLEGVCGLARAEFLESVDGEPITLPLAEPYLLARREGACALLGEDLACSQYEGRPAACRLYPFQALLLDPETGRPVRAAAAGGSAPLLLRHRECPGFTGPPMGEPEWQEKLRESVRLQFGEKAPSDWPGLESALPANVEGTARRLPDSQA